ncbi:hypothetical protein dsat_1340 [Alkalidesulfovibrio alkalitolerans DSM 16529]|uniref:Porin n=1 Tax=Alkalidesulfovibrio alkalitolerans DSM 16529 TaxID=1121439 RepID=S7UEF4_9BACT|nr:outer membrane homotrimeric porin [Alkalidesulfovibrio alkalitolerans]EPR30618.1 hypothetical protein dsat_1340 [Alkalidesulfovibrio alkalitolerans DSM 16529]
MKKLLVLFALAAFVLGAAGMAHALDVKATGEFKANYTYWGNKDWTKSYSGQDQQKHNGLQHRARVYFNFRANENVNMNVAFEIGSTFWGDKTSGGSIAADRTIVKVKRAYLEFKWPTYQSLITTVGTMGAVFPNSGYFGSAIMDDDATGITVANKWNDMVSTVLGFWRLHETEGSSWNRIEEGNGQFDATLLAVPLTFDGFKLKPFVSVAFVGKNGLDGDFKTSAYPTDFSGLVSYSGTGALKNQATPWWVGSGFEVNVLDPFVIYADFNYGSIDQKAKNQDRSGWLADLAVQYNGLSWFVPSLSAWYGSGVDSRDSNGDERMPVIAGSWTQSKMLSSGGRLLNDDAAMIAYVGSWGIGAKLEKIAFIEDLSHDLVFSFYKGTNHKDAAANGLTYGSDLTTKDTVFAIDFNNTYKIMEELSFIADLGIAWPNFHKNTWRNAPGVGNAVDNQTQMWRTSVGFVYKF